MEKTESVTKKPAFRSSTQREAGWAWDLPRAEEPQLALTFYEHLQLRLPKREVARSQ